MDSPDITGQWHFNFSFQRIFVVSMVSLESWTACLIFYSPFASETQQMLRYILLLKAEFGTLSCLRTCQYKVGKGILLAYRHTPVVLEPFQETVLENSNPITYLL